MRWKAAFLFLFVYHKVVSYAAGIHVIAGVFSCLLVIYINNNNDNNNRHHNNNNNNDPSLLVAHSVHEALKAINIIVQFVIILKILCVLLFIMQCS